MLTSFLCSAIVNGHFAAVMKFRVRRIFFLLCWCSGFALDTDIDDLSLNFKQIERLFHSFRNENLIKAVNFGMESTERTRNLERLISTKIEFKKGTISHAQYLDSLPDDDAKTIDNIAQDMLKASSYLLNMHCKNTDISNKDCVKFMSRFSLPAESKLSKKCLKHAKNPKYHAYRRLLPSSYKDGLQKIRSSAVSVKELPLPRTISSVLYSSGLEAFKRRSVNKLLETNNEGIIDSKLSLSVAQWTQFIEQDLSKTVVRSMENGLPIECCDKESVPIQPRYLHPACMPISVPSDDSYYKPIRVTCLNYVRSALAVNSKCKFGGANQLNQATNIFDLSQLYGNDEDDQSKLRSRHHGLLTTSINDSQLLPTTFDESCIRPNETNFPCYYSGDSRVNANPFVTVLYTIFLRSHNHIAKKLRQMIPKWDDNKLFNVSKDINMAIYQKIIYNDWSNVVLGKRMAMEIRNKNYDYDGKKYRTNTVSNEFGVAAIKFYNSLLPGDLKNYHDESYGSMDNIIEAVGIENSRRHDLLKLQDVFYKPKDLSKNNLLEQLMNAILRQNSMAMDSSYVDDLSLQFYRAQMFGNRSFGGDALAYDIQRGRDHGIPSYINYIKRCLNIRVTKWQDLRNIVRDEDLNRMQFIYESVEDVDLLVGALSEIPNENAIVGGTFSCILSEQLISTKLSDEKFYDRRADEMSEKVAKTVDKYSAGRLICDNAKLKQVPKNIFFVPSDENPLIDCSDYEALPKLDLSYWLMISSKS